MPHNIHIIWLGHPHTVVIIYQKYTLFDWCNWMWVNVTGIYFSPLIFRNSYLSNRFLVKTDHLLYQQSPLTEKIDMWRGFQERVTRGTYVVCNASREDGLDNYTSTLATNDTKAEARAIVD